MEATALSLCKSALDGALNYAKSFVAEEIVLQLGVQRDVAIIAEQLEMMKYFLMTGDSEQDRTWLRKVRDLAYNVVDSLQDVAAKMDQSEKPSRWRIPRSVCERRRANLDVKDLLARVADVAHVSKRNLYGRIVKGSDLPTTLAEQSDSDYFAAIVAIDEAGRAGAAGQGKSKVDLRQLITDEVQDLRVIVMWGTRSDLRKLSAMEEAFGLDQEVHNMFDCRAWVKLGCPFSPYEFLSELVSQLRTHSAQVTGGIETNTSGSHVNELETTRELASLAKAHLREKRFLIVIDGISSTVEWDSVKPYFPDERKGSRIIVVTQRVEIASLCTEKPYQISENKVSTSDQAFYLFHKKVEPTTNSDELISVDNEILAIEETLVGRATEKYRVIELIRQSEDEQGCRVISVWGMGGIGKTTLIRSVYRSQQLGGWKRAWATALRPFNPEVLIRSLALQLKDVQEDPNGASLQLKNVQEDPNGASGTQMKNIATMRLEDLIDELIKLLKTHKCLIVLDDISSTVEWDLVKNCLENARRIIVTTREKNIAKHCSREDKNMYRLSGLEDHTALDLFKEKVFKRNDHFDLPPDLFEQAKLILKKCSGLPLAISTIGGFLSDKPKTAIEWKKLNEHISDELEMNPELKTIRTVLMKSYDGLPYHLKSCFLYMSIFPEDYRIRRKRLVRRWIAEGYSKEMYQMTAEEVGDMHFSELCDRSMIQPRKRASSTGKFYYCELHDLIHDICISKSVEEKLVSTLTEGCSSSTKCTVHHLSISDTWHGDKDEFESMLDLSHVRSLTIYGEWRSFFISDKTRFIRVLDLEDALGLRDHHLDRICELLRHLRYLSLQGCKSIFRLPDSLGNLRQLQTLDVRNTHICAFPTTVTNLEKLQYLRTGPTGLLVQDGEVKDDILALVQTSISPSLSSSGKCILRACLLPFFCRLFCKPGLAEADLGRHGPHLLEDGFSRQDVFELYRFCTTPLVKRVGVELPRGFGRLNALMELTVVNVKWGKATLEELEKLTQLRKLGVTGIDRENINEFWSGIAGCNALRSLSVQQTLVGSQELDGCLGGDLSPPKCLESLKLDGKLTKAAEWIHLLQNLSKLQLERTKLNEDAVQAIGKVPKLAVLRLRKESFVGEQLQFQGPSFPSLEVLQLHELRALRTVGFEEHAMPKLSLLQDDWLQRVEGFSGLAFLTILRNIELARSDMDMQESEELQERVRCKLREHPNSVALTLM